MQLDGGRSLLFVEQKSLMTAFGRVNTAPIVPVKSADVFPREFPAP
jgi:hypothetical protein